MHVGGVDGISCQHLQVTMTNLLQERWEWQEERNPTLKHGSAVRPTMYLASLDIKSAFDEAKPKHVAQIMDSHNTHGWLIAALLSEMPGLQGKAMFECVESSFAFNRRLRQGCVEGPRLWQKLATQILANVEEWMKKRMGILLDVEGERAHQIWSFLWADSFWIMSHSKENLELMLRDLIDEASRWSLVPKPTSLWWTSTYDSEEMVDMSLGTTSGCYKFSFEEEFKDPGLRHESARKIARRH